MGRTKEFIKRIPLVGTLGRWVMGCLKMPLRVRDLVEQVRSLQAAVDRPRMAVSLGDNTALAHVRGLKMFMDTRDRSVTPHLLLDGEWEPWVTKTLLETVREGMTVVDVGANVGYYTLLAGRAVGPQGKVFAFEPEPRNFELMQRSVEVNGLKERTTLCPKAVSDKTGTAELHIFAGDYGASHSLFAEMVPGAREHVSVETTSLDAFFAEGTRIDLVKLDAEGAEPGIWRGMKRVLKENPDIGLLLEFAHDHLRRSGEDPGAFLAHIRQAGFPLRRVSIDGTVVDATEEALLRLPFETLFLRRGNRPVAT